MASNLSTIGFVFATEEDFRATMVRYAAETVAQAVCPPGTYGIWRSRAGAEIWFHLSPSDKGTTEICGLTPFFDGQSDVSMKITGAVARNGDNPFEGAFTGWVNPDGTGEGSYPLVFDAVDFAMQAAAPWPSVRRVRLSGFAREIAAFADDAAYSAARDPTDASEPKLAPQAFIPIGLFAAAQSTDDANGADEKPPSSAALFTGRIADHRTFTNEATGHTFEWLLVESLDATFDVLADPAVVQGTIVVGGTVEAAVWLFGRFLDET